MAESKANTNTTKSMQKGSSFSPQEHEKMLKDMKTKFSKEKQVEVSLPESLRKHVGHELFVSVNGVKVVLEIGKKHKLPETIAKHVEDYKDNVRT